ncbi:MAG TPA: hypothetical protein DCM57_01165 [Treponema sp.]|nr:hypothetical protein [Treponema sp.]
MSSGHSIKNIFQRSPLARTLVWVSILLIGLSIALFAGRKDSRKPEVSSVNPPIGAPGDIVVIKGSGFGREKENSFVEISGSRITSSGYRSWSDNEITIELPSNLQDGLFVVQTLAGRSEPLFFANSSGIPVAVRPDPRTSQPTVDSLSPQSAGIGDVVTILGSNFGGTRGNSKVYFTFAQDGTSLPDSGEYIASSDSDYDIEYWSDTEIHVRVPDGAVSGNLYISTDKGSSPKQNFTVNFPVGRKKMTSLRTYVIQVSSDIQNRDGQGSRVTLYVPRPAVSASQPSVEIQEVNPMPLIADDMNNIIHQVTLSAENTSRIRLNQSFIVTDYSIESGIDASKVSRYSDKTRLLYTVYTTADSGIPGSSDVTELSKSIVGKTKSPYDQAKKIYDYMLANYKILNTVRTGNVSVTDMIERKSGDAYDFALLFTALCRAAGIPAVPVSGVLVENNSTTRNHWWSEIYFEHYGWFPVDIALAAGLNYKPFAEIADTAEYYFGNLDSQHIAFSRKWNNLRPALVNSRTVYRPRTYALQTIWEESSSATASYSSLWNDPVVVGIY